MIASAAARLIASHCSSSSPRRAGASTVKYGAGAVRVGVREAAGDDPVRAADLAHRRAPSPSHRVVEGVEALPRDRRLERLATARPSRRTCRAGRARAGTPRARRRPRRRGAPSARSSHVPPCSAQSASAARHPRARPDASADSKPSTSSAREPSPANVSAASRASIRRQFAGCRPGLRRARAPPRRRRRSRAKRTARRRAVRAACGRTRTHASVITPSVPSEPSSSRSGLGPAPEPGSRRDSHAPAGVIARTDSTRSSMCVSRVAKWPPARVAIQPPSVESSNDCGKWRSVQPVRRELLLQRRARARRPGCAPRRETASTSSTRSSAAEVERDRARVAVADARLDAADDARAAAERDHRGARVGRPLEHALDVGLVARARDDVGRVVEAPAEGAHDVAVGAPVGVAHALVAVASVQIAASAAGRREPRRRQLDRLQRHRPLGLGRAEAEVLRAARRPPRAPRSCDELLVLAAPAPVVARAAASRRGER